MPLPGAEPRAEASAEASAEAGAAARTEPQAGLRDLRGRILRDLRISLTDACNFRCSYCMPSDRFGADHRFLSPESLLSFDEILKVCDSALDLGVKKIKLTGGEPLLRPWVPTLIQRLLDLAQNRGIDLDLGLITNGSHLAPLVPRLVDAGLKRITVSLDSLDPEVFARINGRGHALGSVLDGIERAYEARLLPLKINCVVMRGVNDHEVERLAMYFRRPGIELRFIEYMDVGGASGWKPDAVVPSAQLHERMQALGALVERPPRPDSEVAQSFAWADGCGEVGYIASITQPFCGGCTRLRLTADGKLHTCLFGPPQLDLRAMLRADESADAITAALRGLWQSRSDRYSELRMFNPKSEQKTADLPPALALREAMNRLGG